MGRYRLAARLGAGGQGVVYEAYGEAGERVAIKVPRLDDTAALAREAAAAQRVASFCTARVLEVDLDVPYIVSEYVPGPNLRQVGPFDPDGLRRLAIGVATALTAIHQAGVVHRDLKPDNIIVGPDGPRVIDFGVAREAGPTTTSPAMGTPNYMAPEVWAGRGATPAADVWAWGLVVLFAASGSDAVEAQNPLSALDFVPDVSGLPEPLQGLVESALSRDPDDRPTAKDLLLGLIGDSEDPLADGGTEAAPLTGEADPDLGTIAEELFHELSESERTAAPEVFLRLLAADETVRQVPRAEVAGAEEILKLYGAAGLITETDAAYTLAKPGLVHAWPRMRQWVADNRDGLPIHRRLTEAAMVWDGHGRKAGDLLHGSVLDTTLRWAATERRDITLMSLEKEFLDSAARMTRRSNRRRGALTVVLAVLLVVALGATGLAEYRRTTVDRQRDDALAVSLAQRAAGLRELDPKLAMLLSVAARRLAPEQREPRAALNDARAQRYTDTFTDPFASPDAVYATSADGRLLAAVVDGKARVWDVRTHALLATISRVGRKVVNAALTADGRTLALQDGKGVRLWDVATGVAAGDRFAIGADGTGAGYFSFDPSGRALSVQGMLNAGLWDVTSRKALRTPSGSRLDVVNADRTFGLVTSPGVAQGPRKAELWDLRRGKRVKTPWMPRMERISDAAFSADGRLLAYTERLGEGEYRAVVRDLSGRVVRQSPGTAEFSQALAFAFGDAFIAHWDLAGQLVVRRIRDGWLAAETRLPGEIVDVRFDAADRVARLQMYGGVRTLDLSAAFDRPVVEGVASGVPDLIAVGGDGALVETAPPKELGSVAVAPGGRVVANYHNGVLRFWDVVAARLIGAPLTVGALEWNSYGMTFSPDGRRFAFGTHGVVKVFDASTGGVVKTIDTGKDQGIDALAFSPDGTRLAVAPSLPSGESGPVELHDLRSGAVVRSAVAGDEPLVFRPDGQVLISGGVNGLIDVATGATLPRPARSSMLPGPLAFSPDGRLLAVGGPDRISLWSPDLANRLDDFPTTNDGQSAALAWSPDGRTLASYGNGDRVRLWDVATRESLGTVADGLAQVGERYVDLAFSADGRSVVVAALEGLVRTYPVDGDRTEAAVCARAGRTLTRQEWDRYLPGVERFPVCVT
ncbi:serine/threonine-protein kinase [Nonomuraea sp. NPDC050556]|uniref:serine/threonine-protein kinase n=1 Tax=Nonomuraea sp. NPDC050556 TaxID=3364369 RepID=UPI0037AA74A2